MIKRLLILVLLLLSASTVRANTVFITQSGGGAGTSCASPQSFAYFNNAANWSATPSGVQIGPDTTVHLCPATYTFAAGTVTGLAFQGSGTSGHPIIVTTDGAVVITAPYWGPGSGNNAAIDVNGKSFITIDGQNRLTIQATANGTLLANQKNFANGILAKGGSNVTIQNLTVSNIYVHACTLVAGADPAVNCTDTVGDATGDISAYGNNLTIQNCILHDAKDGIGLNYSGGASLSNEVITGNTIYNIDHGVELGVSNAGSSVSNVYIAYNVIHDFQNWDTSITLNTFHHDADHVFTNSGGSATNVYSYGNIVTGNFGFNFNSAFFSEPFNAASALFYFENVVNDQSTVSHQGCGMFCQEVDSPKFYYNTVIQSGASANTA